MPAPNYTPTTASPGSVLNASAMDSIIDGLQSVNMSTQYTHGQQVMTANLGGAASFTLTSSSPLFDYGTYMILFNVRSTTAALNDNIVMIINGDTSAANYVHQSFSGASVSWTNSVAGIFFTGAVPAASATAKYSLTGAFFITGFGNQTNAIPTVVGIDGGFANTTTAFAEGNVCAYYNTAPPLNITNLKFQLTSGANFANGSTIGVWGLT